MSLEGKSAEEIERLAGWAQKILTSPETRTEALRMTRKADPTFRNAEIELDDKIAAATKASDDKVEKLEDQLRRERLERQHSEKKTELAGKGYDIDVLDKIMVDNKVGSYDGAMKIFDAEKVLAPGTTPEYGGATRMPTDMKEISKNPNQWARDKAAEVLKEFATARGGR